MALTIEELVYAEAVDVIGEIELDDDSDQSIKPYSTCARHFANARDEMIRGYAWNEATKYGLCLETSIKPLHTYSFRFALPSDLLRPITTSRPREDWRIVGSFAHTNYSLSPDTYTVAAIYQAGQYIKREDITYAVNTTFAATVWTTDASFCTTTNGDFGFIELEYVKKMDSPTDWSVDLRQAIVLNLASKIVIPITSDRERRKEIKEELHQLVLPHSMAIDAMSGKPKQMFYSDWTDSRGQY